MTTRTTKNLLSTAEIKERVRHLENEMRRLDRALNGPPVKCDVPGCTFTDQDRNKFRIRTTSERDFILCRPCANVLYTGEFKIASAPYLEVLRNNKRQVEESLNHWKKMLEFRVAQEKEARVHQEIVEKAKGEHPDFFAAILGGKGAPSPEQAPETDAALLEVPSRATAPLVEAARVRRETNREKKRRHLKASRLADDGHGNNGGTHHPAPPEKKESLADAAE